MQESSDNNTSKLDEEIGRLSEFHHGYSEIDDEQKWQKFKKLVEFFKIRNYNCDKTPRTDGIFCNASDDYFACYPATKADTTIYHDCPYRNDFYSDAKISRYCNANGTWQKADYKPCVVAWASSESNSKCHLSAHSNSSINCGVNDNSFAFISNLYLVGFIITLIAVVIGMTTFLSFKSLRCVRNNIHVNMLATFLIKCSTFIAYHIFAALNYNSVSNGSHFMCVVLYVIWNYSLLTSFFWMMIEAIYLITLILAVYSSSKIKLWWYLIIGWVLPLIPMLPFTILTIKSNNKTCSWMKPDYKSNLEWFIDAPIYATLLINSILLIIILSIIVKKLRTTNDINDKWRYKRYKKLFRATFLLFPLFGLTFAIFAWNPEPGTIWFQAHFYVNIFLQTTQGIWVTLVYCLLNEEVKSKLINKFRSWKATRKFVCCKAEINKRCSRITQHTIVRSQSLNTLSKISIAGQPDANPDPTMEPMLDNGKLLQKTDV